MYGITSSAVLEFLIDAVVLLAEIITNKLFLMVFFFSVFSYITHLIYVVVTKTEEIAESDSLF